MKNALMLFALLVAMAAPGEAQEQLPLGSRVGDAPPAGYDAGGRRDPFVSLLPSARRGGTSQPSRPVSGLAGLSVADATVTGIIRSGSTVMAILSRPRGKSFNVRVKDRLQDGVVKGIDADSVVFAERVSDTSGAVQSRDVRKPVRALLGVRR